MFARALHATTLVLVIAVPMLYVSRTGDQRPLRGKWLLGITAVLASMPAIAWYCVLRRDLGGLSLDQALAATVPLAQLALQLSSLKLFEQLAGRPPAKFVFRGERQSTIDTLMHGFEFFVIALGGIVAFTSLWPGVATTAVDGRPPVAPPIMAGHPQAGGSISMLLMWWLGPPVILWLVAYLVLICLRERLPFHEAEIVAAELEDFTRSKVRSRFVVRFDPVDPGIRIRKRVFWFVFNGELEKAKTLPAYKRVCTYYFVGKRLKLHYLPNWEWLFGFLPETPGLPPGTGALVLMLLGLGAVLAISYLQAGAI